MPVSHNYFAYFNCFVNIQTYMPYLYKNMECSVENNQNFQSLKERLDSKEIIVAPGI